MKRNGNPFLHAVPRRPFLVREGDGFEWQQDKVVYHLHDGRMNLFQMRDD